MDSSDQRQKGTSARPGARSLRPGQPLSADDLEIFHEFVAESVDRLEEADGHLLRLESTPGELDALHAVFRCFHTIKGLAGFLQLTEVERLAHATEDLLDQARRGVRPLTGQSIDRVFAAVDAQKRLIRDLASAADQGKALPVRHDSVQELVLQIEELVGRHSPAAQVPAEVARAADAPRSTPPAQPASEAEGEDRHETIRIDAERLDRLVDMLGELVITETMVMRATEREGRLGADLVRHLMRMNKITRELQELGGSLRMVPVRATFQRMARLARDVAKKSGKRVDFRISGAETELDKSVVDRIAEPLVHLVRNAIDHGLERDPEARRRAGKSDVGRVDLRAYHRGGNIVVDVEDDGGGLDEAKILKKAVERGLVREGDAPKRRDIFQLICAPGFSTAETVSSISGRGVGMDVVKRQIDTMGGALEIRSEPGRGTCFSMQLPLTLAVIDGMVIRLGVQKYIVPTLSVVRLVTPEERETLRVLGRGEVLTVQGEFVSVLRLDRLFDVRRDEAGEPLAIVAEAGGTRVAIFIDELIGQQQAVIKSLGAGLGEIPGVSGCAIMPDGRVGLVLEIGALVRLFAQKSQPVTANGHRTNPEPEGAQRWSV